MTQFLWEAVFPLKSYTDDHINVKLIPLISLRRLRSSTVNKEGFTTICRSNDWCKARIGNLGDDEDSCSSWSSRTGFGMRGFPDESNTLWKCSINRSNNGDRRITAMGHKLVQRSQVHISLTISSLLSWPRGRTQNSFIREGSAPIRVQTLYTAFI